MSSPPPTADADIPQHLVDAGMEALANADGCTCCMLTQEEIVRIVLASQPPAPAQDDVLRDFAAKIRKLDCGHEPTCACLSPNFYLGVDKAADLIDPDVTS